jgi:hypothetical protein
MRPLPRSNIKSTPLPEEQFTELFKAARVLSKEDIREEDQIVPTLAFAGWSGPAYDITSAVRERFAKIGNATRRWRLF